MEDSQFDAVTRSFALPSRRRLFGTLTAALAALLGPGTPNLVSGKRKKRRKKRKRSSPVVSPPASPPGCGAGLRACPARGGCIPAAQCCTDADCAPWGTCTMATGTCDCTNPVVDKTCDGAPGVCAQCCSDDDCGGDAVCRDRACRCPEAEGACGCYGDGTNPEPVVFCGTGMTCACFVAPATPPGSDPRRCGVIELMNCAECTSPLFVCADPSEFCALCVPSSPASGGTCTHACPA
jgi:hypothetical protein